MPAVRVPAILVVDPGTGLPLAEARGQVGTIVAEGTNTPLTLSVDKAGTIPIQQPITITPGGYIPQHWNQEGLRGTFVPLSGTWSTPVWSPQGLEEAAATSAAAAEVARAAAVAAAKPIVAGANVTVTEVDGTLVVASTGGTGGTAGTVPVTGITGAAAPVESLLESTNAAQARQAIGAGTSDVAAAWTAAGLPNGTPIAAPAAETFRKSGTGAGTQTVTVPVDFTSTVGLKDDALQIKHIAALRAELDALINKPGIVIVETQGDDPIAAGGRPGDAVMYVNAAPTGGGEDPDPPVDTTALRRRFLTGVADNTAHTLAGGTGDTPLTTQSGSPFVQVVDGIPRVHVVGTSAQTWRDNPASASPAGDLPALGVFSVDVLLRVMAYPPSTTTWMIGSGAFSLTMTITGAITVLNGAGSVASASVGGGPAGSSSALALDTDYHVKLWRPSTATGTLAQFAVYAADGETMVWPTSGTPAGRDIGTANLTAWIRGKTAPVAGEWLIGQERLDDVGTVLAAL